MREQEAKEPIRIFLDDNEEPFKVAHPPLRFSLSTIPLADGEHVLRVQASNGLAPPTVKEIPFRVRNGVAVTVSGLEPGQTIGGQVELIVNAYAGNTEVDFEPRRAETPQPIPTWAWVLSLGVLAWTMFYVFNPARPPRDASATTFTVDRSLGERLYMDTCARCHEENGDGRRSADNPDDYLVKKLRDTPNLAVDETPYKLLFRVVTGTGLKGGVQMPAWGPRFTNEEIVAVVNYVRSSWGHDASQIEPTFRRPPPGIDELEDSIADALVTKDVRRLETCCWPDGVRPQLYRIDGPRWAVGKDEVLDEWKGYFEALGKGEIVDFQLTDVRYAYEPEAVENVGAYVFAMGRIFLNTRAGNGKDESDTGRFIRVYKRVHPSGAPAEPSTWALVFDFASIRMRVGCEVEPDVECPPGTEPLPPAVPDAASNELGYADIQAIFAGLKRDPGDAPHGYFWEDDYDAFIHKEFAPSWGDDKSIKLLVVGNSAESNLVKALRDGKGITVTKPDGTVTRMNIQPMPKGSKMPPELVEKIAAWIDAGCPQFAGKAQVETKGPVKDVVPRKSASAGSGAIGWKDVQAIFASLGRDPGDAPHDRFWEQAYEDVVGQAFPFSWDDPEMTVTYVVPWDSKSSNLIRALTDGKGIEVRSPDGRVMRRNIGRMPKGASPMSDEDIQRLAAWIDAGCPKEAGGPSPWPKPGAASPPPEPAKDQPAKEEPRKDEPAKKEPAKPEPAKGEPEAAESPPPPVDPAPPPPPSPREGPPPAPPEPPSAVEQPKTSPLGFEDVLLLFKKLRQKAPNAPHSSFWRELSYGEFVKFEFREGPGKEGRIRLLVPWDSAASNMIKALRNGKGVTVRMPDGSMVTRDIAPMPKDADPMPAADIQKLADWIDAGCPEKAGEPSALPRR